MSYRQLTREQRYQIAALKSAGHYQHQIAAVVGVHQSTVCRELRRHAGARQHLRPPPSHAGLDEMQDYLRVLGVVLIPGVVQRLVRSGDSQRGYQAEFKT